MRKVARARHQLSSFTRVARKGLEVRSKTTQENGIIKEVSADDFSVNVGRNRFVRVPYAGVVSVRRERRVSKGDWIAIGAVSGGLAALIRTAGWAIASSRARGSCQGGGSLTH
jgi:hypothetical protein